VQQEQQQRARPRALQPVQLHHQMMRAVLEQLARQKNQN
jgi:hypothetical protein